jgi:hypothetical protein
VVEDPVFFEGQEITKHIASEDLCPNLESVRKKLVFPSAARNPPARNFISIRLGLRLPLWHLRKPTITRLWEDASSSGVGMTNQKEKRRH